MNIKIDDIGINSRQVIYNDRRFGDSSIKTESKYEISLSVKELFFLFEIEYDTYVNECEDDDNAFNEIDIPMLREAGYPSLQEALNKNEEIFISLMKEYIY
ncbi:hypothetical protein [Vibrio nigripulchritudo]|uniref:hypothetical protein n=1 Tax=Vibrio nigripulchritudo TaxID=28173 RepID=UPI0003B1F7A7|nr:hypothetical protein [Vibrio nigripulchritudo]CCN72618.1 hypothetical protein VIBNISFn118_630008 [Vibrio nigripulchritudo SFn118]